LNGVLVLLIAFPFIDEFDYQPRTSADPKFYNSRWLKHGRE
jgi:hypothetical protein